MLGQVSNNVATARAWMDKVTAPAYQRNAYENFVVDAYSAVGITKSSDIKDDASLAQVAGKLGVSTEGLLKAMGGRCPFGGGMPQPTAKQS